MTSKFSTKSIARVSTLALTVALGGAFGLVAHPGVAQAKTSVDQLEQQIQELQGELQELRSQQSAAQQQAVQASADAQAAAQAAVAAKKSTEGTAHTVLTAGNRPGWVSNDGRTAIYLTTRLHIDAGDYLNVSRQGTPGRTSLESGLNARRARIGILGKFLGDWNYALIYDFGGTADNGNSGSNGTSPSSGGIENAFVTYTGFKPFSIDLGYEDVPWTLDESTSSNDIMFMERSSIQTIVTGLVGGDFRSAFGVHGNTDRLWGGLYLTGPQSGSTHNSTTSNEQQANGVGRVGYQVLQDPGYSLHVGGDVGYMFNRGASATFTPSDRPELRVDTTSFIGVDSSGAGIPVKNALIYGPELAGGFGSFFAQGEYYRLDVDQNPVAATNGGHTPHLHFSGGYVQASYTLTGEHRKYLPATGAYSGITPAHPFSFANGTWGAWEVAARFSQADIDSQFATGLARTATGGYEGGKQYAFAVGLNWYVNTNVRFMWDYEHVEIDNHQDTAGALNSGQHIDWLGMRTQVAF